MSTGNGLETHLRNYSAALRQKVQKNTANTTPRRKSFPEESKIPIPPPSLTGMTPVGTVSSWRATALTSIGRLNMAGLRPDHDVLDLGCGIGRMARYLCDYLENSSQYRGFDVVPERIEWCQSSITSTHPNFQFELVRLWNSYYAPDPSLPRPESFRFPYDDNSFDFAFAHSVFTHLLPDSALNYLHEMGRVLRPGGICYSTWFWFNEDPSSYSHRGTTQMERDESGLYALRSKEQPEMAVGHLESAFRAMVREAGLEIVEPLHPGFGKLQDVSVAVKPRSAT